MVFSCCEKTLQVLRDSKEGILTILEVFMYDPLHQWSLTPEKAYKMQHGREPDEGTKRQWERDSSFAEDPNRGKKKKNQMAERALLRVIQKLNGMEEGNVMSVSGQVNTLTQQARDPARLCAIFPGWQPYL